MKTIQLAISETINKERVKRGEVAIHVPMIEDILPHLVQAKVKVEDGKEVIEDGIPVYDNEPANWLVGAILNTVKMTARNKVEIVNGKVQLKDGATIPSNWEEFTAESTGRGNSAALALAREAKEKFAAWVSTLGKSEKASATMITLFSNRAALEVQKADTKSKMKAYIEQFAETLSEEDLSKLEKPLTNVLNAAASDGAADDF